MATRQYVGARYVPKFATPTEWNAGMTYEALTIVTYLNASYTSKIPVPAGIVPTNETYWALTGNYNAQVEQYRQEVEQLQTTVDDLTPTVNNFKANYFNVKAFGAKGDGTTDDTVSFQNALNAVPDGGSLYIPLGRYRISQTIVLDKCINLFGDGGFPVQIWDSSLPLIGTVLEFYGVATGVQIQRAGTQVKNITVINRNPQAGSGGFKIELDSKIGIGSICLRVENCYALYFSVGFWSPSITFKSVFTNCVTRDCETGFQFASGSTSLTLLNCWVMFATNTAYVFNGTVYSTLINCGADNCGTGYSIQQSAGTTILNCGAEDCQNTGFYLMGCTDCTVQGCNSYRCNQGHDTQFNETSGVFLRDCTNVIVFNHTDAQAPEGTLYSIILTSPTRCVFYHNSFEKATNVSGTVGVDNNLSVTPIS